MRYSHFGCNVVHEDIAFSLGVDTHKEKMTLKHIVELHGGKLPAEHGHGTEYVAPPVTQQRWMAMDALNVLNPGIGGLSTLPKYGK
jgi:D-lactate dehydrogenase